VALARKYTYKNGMLMYTDGHKFKLKILDLHKTVSDELVVDIQLLVQAERPHFSAWSQSEVQPLHYSNGVISCLLRKPEGTLDDGGWLIFWAVDNPAETVRMSYVETTSSIFVRNNSDYLYCGALDFIDDTADQGWVLRGFDLRDRAKNPELIPLLDFTGNETGRNVCFEVIDDALYGVSSEQICDPESHLWNSFYDVFRLTMRDNVIFQRLPILRSWRRHGSEGPIDNRWASLDLVKDERTGEAILYEIRKEWSAHSSYSQRNCYRKVLNFPPADPDSEMPDHEETDPEPAEHEAYREDRLPSDLHAGDCGSNSATPSFMAMIGRSYNSSARCFVDLIKYRSPGIMGGEFVRLRVRPMLLSQMNRVPDLGGQTMLNDPGVLIWPPSLDAGQPGDPMERVSDILKVPPGARRMNVSADERCLVFSYDSGDNTQNVGAVNVICFDPGVRFHGHHRLAAAQSAYNPPWEQSMPRGLAPKRPHWLSKAQANYGWIQDGCFDFSL
jgi:hypothetical protein